MISDIPDGNVKLCENLNIKWSQSFWLLGIDFDAKLVTMNKNYDKVIKKIESIMVPNCVREKCYSQDIIAFKICSFEGISSKMHETNFKRTHKSQIFISKTRLFKILSPFQVTQALKVCLLRAALKKE